jgi:hypothetical protein
MNFGSLTGLVDAGEPWVTRNVELLKTADVANIAGTQKSADLIDLITNTTFNITWHEITAGYHTDWSPSTPADTAVIQRILDPDRKVTNWNNTSAWSFDPRPGILCLHKRYIAVGFHLRPHGSIVGYANPGPPLISEINVQPRDRVPPLSTWPMGGHMCMYYGDSRSGRSGPNESPAKPLNDAARDAFEWKL